MCGFICCVTAVLGRKIQSKAHIILVSVSHMSGRCVAMISKRRTQTLSSSKQRTDRNRQVPREKGAGGRQRQGRKAKELTVIALAGSDLCRENQSGGDECVHFPCLYICMFVFQLCNDDAIQAAGPSWVLCSGECWPLCFLWSQGACIHCRFDPLTFIL